MVVRLLSRALGTGGTIRRLFGRRDIFDSLDCLHFREGPGQFLTKHCAEVLDLLKIADLQNPPAGANLSRPKRLGKK